MKSLLSPRAGNYHRGLGLFARQPRLTCMPVAVLALVAALVAPHAHGQNTWVGGAGGDGLWATGTNWSTASAPVGTYNQTLVFAGSPLLSSTNNISGLTLLAGTAIRFDAAGFALSGSAITLNGNIFNAATSGTNTISLAGITVSSMRTISGSFVSGTASSLVSTTVVSSNIDGAGGITLGLGSNTTGDVPIYTLTGSNSFTGGFTLSNNTTLNASSANAFGANLVGNKLSFGIGTINYTGASTVFANNVDLTMSGSPIVFNLNNASLEFGGTTVGTRQTAITVNSGTVVIRLLSGTGGGPSVSGGILNGSNGTLVFKEASSFSGNFRLSDSTNARVLLGHGQALGTGTIAATSATSMPIGSTQDVTVANTTFSTGAGVTLSLGGDYRFTVEKAIVGSGTLRKFGSGVLDLTAVNTYSGTTAVAAGTLLVNGSILNSPTVTVASGATLGGSGSVVAITGAGLVSPGNSPGILTGTSVTLSSGLDFAFEFAQANEPTWSTGTASGNDVLRLTNLTTPISGNATAANVFDIYFAADGQTYRGGLFTDRTSSFESSIANATYNYFVQNATGTVTFNGTKYNALASAEVTRSTVQVTSANFSSGGTVSNGYTMEFVVVPEPQTIVLFGIGSAVIGWSLLNRRRRTTERSAD